MSLISCRKINKNIFIFLIIIILVETCLAFLNFNFEPNNEEVINNTFLKKLIAYSFYLLFGTILMIIRKCSPEKRRKNKNY